MPLESILSEYARLERSIPLIDVSSVVTYRSPVNFRESMETPRHRWFPYKEGFSPSFVRNFVERFGAEEGCVLDPFSGVGTTVIEAASIGRCGVGIDVSPLADFVARTKAQLFASADIATFSGEIDKFAADSLFHEAAPPPNATVISYFEPEVLSALLRVKAYYGNIDDERIAALFRLAFLSMLEKYSTHRKAGNGLKRKTRVSTAGLFDVVGVLRADMARLLRIIRQDLVVSPQGETSFFLGSALETASFPQKDISCVLTSPPYANCFDYSKIYICELWLGDFFKSKEDQVNFRARSVRSHVHATWGPRHEELGSSIVANLIKPQLAASALWSSRIPDMVEGYFSDLGRLLQNLKSVTVSGCRIGLVVSNSAYGGVPVATDLLTAETALSQGFAIDRIEIYRGIVPSSQQYNIHESKKYFRESLVVVKTP